MKNMNMKITTSTFFFLFVICCHSKECSSFCTNSVMRRRRPSFIAPYPPPKKAEGGASTMPSSSKTTSLSMGDRSSATRFCVGDAVTVVEEVAKAGKSLRGLSGVVVETWEKCDVDPTCCCAEWVDESLSIRVRFAASKDSGNGLFTNDSFFHYFSESELLKEKENSAGDTEVVAFDGLSCKAFKLEKLSMGQQAKRIAAFEETRH